MQKTRMFIYEVVQSLIALMIVAGFMAVLGYSIIHGLPKDGDNAEGMILLIGALNTLIGAVCQTYFRQRDARVNDTPDNRREN